MQTKYMMQYWKPKRRCSTIQNAKRGAVRSVSFSDVISKIRTKHRLISWYPTEPVTSDEWERKAFVSNVSTLEAGWIGASVSSTHDAGCTRGTREEECAYIWHRWTMGEPWCDGPLCGFLWQISCTHGGDTGKHGHVPWCIRVRRHACVRACIRGRSALNQR